MTTETTERIQIPNWVIKIFNEDQEDPDKDPGFTVTARLWTDKGTLLFEASFAFVGQDDERMFSLAVGSGFVHSCTVHWKGNTCVAEHDMQGLEPVTGDAMEVNLHNLRRLS